MALEDFLEKWFLNSMFNQEGYNVVNTTVFALLLILAAWLLYEKWLKKAVEKGKISIDRKFVFALTGWILAGSSLRVLRDLGYYETFWFVTPGIFFVVFLPAALALWMSIKYRGKEYCKYWALPGYAFAAFNILRLPLGNLYGLALVLAITLFLTLFLLFSKKIVPKFATSWNLGVLWAHLFDATNTFVAIQFFSFRELHVLPTALISSYGPWVMFPLKLIVVGAVLYYIDKYSEDENESKYIKLLILLLGLATSTRNFLGIVSY